jgi:hypothetical protein
MGLGSGIRDPGFGKNLFRIPDPGVKKAPDPGSATLIASVSVRPIRNRTGTPTYKMYEKVLTRRIAIHTGQLSGQKSGQNQKFHFVDGSHFFGIIWKKGWLFRGGKKEATRLSFERHLLYPALLCLIPLRARLEVVSSVLLNKKTR